MASQSRIRESGCAIYTSFRGAV